MGNNVFISYSREDKNFVLKLAKDLKHLGIPVWLDQWDILPGGNWDREINRALLDCTSELLILSPASVLSNIVQSEWITALQEKKLVIPILYQKCIIPSMLRPYQYVDFTPSGPDYQTNLEFVLKALRPNLPKSSGAQV